MSVEFCRLCMCPIIDGHMVIYGHMVPLYHKVVGEGFCGREEKECMCERYLHWCSATSAIAKYFHPILQFNIQTLRQTSSKQTPRLMSVDPFTVNRESMIMSVDPLIVNP
jgi:hypothetical protein